MAWREEHHTSFSDLNSAQTNGLSGGEMDRIELSQEHSPRSLIGWSMEVSMRPTFI
jgi:hypothetical protein